MAGGIGTYAVDGVTFATIGAAITQLIADEDGAALTADQILLLSINTTENPILPTHTQVNTSGQFNVVLRGTGASKTITGNITSSGVSTDKCRFFFMDDIVLNSGANDGITLDNQAALHLLIKDSDITSTGTKNCLFDVGNVIIEDSNLDAGFRAIRFADSVILRGVKIKCDEGIELLPSAAGGDFYMENCRMVQSGSSTLKFVFLSSQVSAQSSIFLQNTFSGFIDIILSNISSDAHAGPIIFENNIFDTFTHIFKSIAVKALAAPFITGASPWVMRDNILSNQTGTDLLVFNDQTLTNAQAISEGIDNGTKTFNVTFQSTVFSNANFLKHVSGDDTDVKFARPSGIIKDFAGTSKIGSPVSAGAFEPAAITADAKNVPVGLAATDPQTNGDLTVTITNAVDYAAGDKIDVFNNAGGALLGSFDAAVGSGTISGLTNGVLITIKAKSSSPGRADSAFSSTTTGTPTAATALAGGGKLAFTGIVTSTTLDLFYTPGVNFSSANLFKRKVRDGFTESQAAVSGLNTATGLTAGEKYEFWVVPKNISGSTENISNIVIISLIDDAAIGDEFFDLLWRKEGDTESDWRSERMTIDVTRKRVKTNITGHLFQWRVLNETPNTKIVIRSVQIEARLRGKEYSSEQQ